MDPSILIVVAYGLAVLWLGYDMGRKVERKAQERARCSHTWDYRSLDNLDHHWQRVCLICGEHEDLKNEEVPYHERCKATNYPPREE